MATIITDKISYQDVSYRLQLKQIKSLRAGSLRMTISINDWSGTDSGRSGAYQIATDQSFENIIYTSANVTRLRSVNAEISDSYIGRALYYRWCGLRNLNDTTSMRLDAMRHSYPIAIVIKEGIASVNVTCESSEVYTGSVKSGDIVYEGDVLRVSVTPLEGYMPDSYQHEYTVTAAVRIAPNARLAASVHVFDGQWSTYLIKIYTGGAWQDYAAWLYENGKWQTCT